MAWKRVTTVAELRDLPPDAPIRVNGKEKTVGNYANLYVTDTPLLEAVLLLDQSVERQVL